MMAMRISMFWIIFFIALNIVSSISSSYLSETGQPLFYETRNISMLNETKPLQDNIQQMQEDMIRPEAQLEGIITTIFGAFIYVVKGANYLITIIWNSTLGMADFLYLNFAIPYAWGDPIMIIINLIHFLGLIEFLTGRILG